METIDITVIGAGAVGLAVAARLAGPDRSVLVLEKNERFGQETSSRSSEVIHAGMYYHPGTLKARLCVRGNALLYEHCARRNVPCRRLGKLIVAVTEAELPALAALLETGRRNGVSGLEMLAKRDVEAREPGVRACGGLFSPCTGIFDTHAFMQSLLAEAKEKGALIAYNSEVTGVERTADGLVVRTAGDGEGIRSGLVINCAGLRSDAVAAAAGIDTEAAEYRLHYCKGNYFRLRRPRPVRHLVYPVPEQGMHGLGIHLTADLAGGVRFGPDTRYVETVEYGVDEDRRELFAQAIQRYLPGVRADELVPDTCGIRPKLQGPGDGIRDFVIRRETGRGLPSLINLIGIDSPGLTSSLAIAEYVEQLL
jgi:L-2-hydroxyglutarate oxidase LhgO